MRLTTYYGEPPLGCCSCLRAVIPEPAKPKTMSEVWEEDYRKRAASFQPGCQCGLCRNQVPPGHPWKLLDHDGRKIYVDEKLVDLLPAFWRAGYETIGSCQGSILQDGFGYVGFIDGQTRSDFLAYMTTGLSMDVELLVLEAETDEDAIAEVHEFCRGCNFGPYDFVFVTPVTITTVHFPLTCIPGLIDCLGRKD